MINVGSNGSPVFEAILKGVFKEAYKQAFTTFNNFKILYYVHKVTYLG